MNSNAGDIKVVHSDLNVLLADGTKLKKNYQLPKRKKQKILCQNWVSLTRNPLIVERLKLSWELMIKKRSPSYWCLDNRILESYWEVHLQGQ